MYLYTVYSHMSPYSTLLVDVQCTAVYGVGANLGVAACAAICAPFAAQPFFSLCALEYCPVIVQTWFMWTLQTDL